MAYKALQIAQLLLSKAAEGNQELMSNLKLQKMLYYEQGFHLAAFDTPLFDENIEAWMFGPVVPEVYEKYAKYDAKGIEPPPQIDIKLNEEETTLFNNVFYVYNQYSAVKLVEMTPSGPPWNSVTPGKGNIISQESMKKFFLTRLA